MIDSLQQTPSFKGYIPVKYYAKNPSTNEYVPVLKQENIRKCHSFVVRNLNGTAKKMKNDEFVKLYKSHDRDYALEPKVHSIYSKNEPVVYIVSGDDAYYVNELAKPLGISKSESLNQYGSTKTTSSYNAAKEFYSNVKSFLNRQCTRLKSQNNKDLTLKVYFNPKYTRNNDLKGFEFVKAKFTEENYF